MSTDEVNGWAEYKRLVVVQLEEHGKEIERLRSAIHDLRKTVQEMALDLARLNVKASIWGAVAGVLTGGLAAIMQHLGK